MSAAIFAWLRHLRRLGAERRGVAALELAIAFPVVLLVFGNIVDYGLMMRQHAQLATGVGNAAGYASLAGMGVSSATLQTVAAASSGLAGVSASATGAACYCPSGTPRKLGAAVACNSTCADGTAAAAYVTITASYIYTPFFPGLNGMSQQTLTHTAAAMVQ